jgi:hypothetical protein
MKVLIWSNEHKGWWRPQQCGYTNYIECAGEYEIEEAIKICNEANERIKFDHEVTEATVPPNETIMPILPKIY